MVPTSRIAVVLLLISALPITSALQAWEILPTSLTGTESQSVDFDIVVAEEDWAPAGTVCNDAVWDFEFQLDGILVDGTAEWGVDLSSPFSGGVLTGICSDSDDELITPYTIAMIEDFIPEDNEDAEIFFEHCEETEGEGTVICTDETLSVEVIEVAGGGLPEVGLFKIRDAAEPVTDGRFSVALEAPAPDGGVTINMAFGGTASPGSDYVALTGSVFIPEGSAAVEVDVEVINDGLLEGTETVMITLLEDTDYVIGFQHERITILIEDDDGETPFEINQGISDAWFNSAMPGQGFFIIVFPEIGKIFMGWFTYDTQRPPANVQAILGDPGHRWLTALGDFGGNTAVLDIEFTEGGVFNMVPPQTSQTTEGTITLEFFDCVTGLVHFEIPSLGLSGTVPIERLTPDNVGLCEAQNGVP